MNSARSSDPEAVETNRSREPKRSRVPSILMLSAGAVFVMLFASTWFMYSVMYAKPNVRINYAAEIHTLFEGAQPAGANGWDTFIQAVHMFHGISEAGFLEAEALDTGEESDYSLYTDYDRVRYGDADPKRWSVELKELTQLRDAGAFDVLERALAKSNIVAPPLQSNPDEYSGALMYASNPMRLGDIRQMAKAIAAEMRLAAIGGDLERHHRFTRLGFGLARATSLQPSLISWLVGVAMTDMLLDELNYELMEVEFSRDHCMRLYETVERNTDWAKRLDLHMEGERLECLDAIQCWYTERSRGRGRVIVTRIPVYDDFAGFTVPRKQSNVTFADRFENFRAFNMPDRLETTEQVNRFFDLVVAYTRRPVHEQVRQLPQIESQAPDVDGRSGVFEILVSSLDRVVRSSCRLRIEVGATLAMLVVESYIAEQGAPPASLNALDDHLKRMLPADPIQPDGAWFGYRRLETPDEHGRTYLVYSIGLDGEDNGGREPTKTSRRNVIIQTDGSEIPMGSDYRINEPRSDYFEW